MSEPLESIQAHPDWPRDPSVPLSAIRALVQQWREQADTTNLFLEASTLAVCANELEALCPAPPEDQQPQG
jgi:hypothetical protein